MKLSTGDRWLRILYGTVAIISLINGELVILLGLLFLRDEMR